MCWKYIIWEYVNLKDKFLIFFSGRKIMYELWIIYKSMANWVEEENGIHTF